MREFRVGDRVQARDKAERKERAAREEKEREARAKLARDAEESDRRRRKAAAADAAANFQTLLSEAVKDPDAPWHEWKQRLARDPQVRDHAVRVCSKRGNNHRLPGLRLQGKLVLGFSAHVVLPSRGLYSGSITQYL